MDERVTELRAQIIEFIEIAVVELKNVAQPREIGELRALGLDAEDADSVEQLELIKKQAQNLREFCESRKMSSNDYVSAFMPPQGRRRAT